MSSSLPSSGTTWQELNSPARTCTRPQQSVSWSFARCKQCRASLYVEVAHPSWPSAHLCRYAWCSLAWGLVSCKQYLQCIEGPVCAYTVLHPYCQAASHLASVIRQLCPLTGTPYVLFAHACRICTNGLTHVSFSNVLHSCLSDTCAGWLLLCCCLQRKSRFDSAEWALGLQGMQPTDGLAPIQSRQPECLWPLLGPHAQDKQELWPSRLSSCQQ